MPIEKLKAEQMEDARIGEEEKREAQAVRPAEEKQPARSGGACGFENKQYTGEKRMFCSLQKDHAGDHAAPYPEDGSDPKFLVGFSEAAGVPFSADVQAKLDAQRKAAKEKAEAKAKQ